MHACCTEPDSESTSDSESDDCCESSHAKSRMDKETSSLKRNDTVPKEGGLRVTEAINDDEDDANGNPLQ